MTSDKRGEMDNYLNKIIQGDCLEVMKGMPDKSVDLVLTDPPYGKKASKGTNGFGSAKNRRYVDDWDNSIPSLKVFNEMLRIGKNVMIFGGNYFAHLLPPSKCWLIWDKKGDIKFHNPFADCELIYTNFSKPIKKYTFKQQGFITDSKDKRYHPTQKPTELLEILIRDWTRENSLILDPFVGSGTTCISAKKLNRNFIGIEISPEYCKIANQRLAQEVLL